MATATSDNLSTRLFLLTLVVTVQSVPSYKAPAGLRQFAANEYEYSAQRDNFLSAEDVYEGHDRSTLSPDEQVVNSYLGYLKWAHFQDTNNKKTGFPPSRPIEEQLTIIKESKVFKALKKLPKGANMHSHEDHELSKKKLLEIIFDSPEFEYLYMLPGNHSTAPWTLDFYVNPPTAEWIKVKDSGLKVQDIVKYQTLIGILSKEASRYPTDSDERWNQINPLWGRGSTQLIANINIKKKYLEAIYQHGLDEGVVYIETRKNLGPFEALYEMDPSGQNSVTNGKKFFDPNGDPDVQAAKDASQKFSAAHPEFFGHRRIAYAYRGLPDAAFAWELKNAARLQAPNPDHVLGFDAVGGEDAGYSLLYYLQKFLAGGAQLPLYLHAAETSYPDDLISTFRNDDLVSTGENAVDALLLKSKSIVHASAFVKHPYRMEYLRQNGLAIQTTPVSSQLLGYSADLRQDSAQIYYRAGIPLVLGSDDPGTMGYDDFTVDWYEVFMAWGLDLSDLKKLALNSLQYSGLSEADKKKAVDGYWKPMWDKYIAAMKAEACAKDFKPAAGVTFNRILPREGANSGSTRVHIYGRNFETAICKTPKCRFGSVGVSDATYIDNTHLVCNSPSPPSTNELKVAVEVALDGVNFVATGQDFTYKYPVFAAAR